MPPGMPRTPFGEQGVGSSSSREVLHRPAGRSPKAGVRTPGPGGRPAPRRTRIPVHHLDGRDPPSPHHGTCWTRAGSFAPRTSSLPLWRPEVGVSKRARSGSRTRARPRRWPPTHPGGRRLGRTTARARAWSGRGETLRLEASTRGWRRFYAGFTTFLLAFAVGDLPWGTRWVAVLLLLGQVPRAVQGLSFAEVDREGLDFDVRARRRRILWAHVQALELGGPGGRPPPVLLRDGTQVKSVALGGSWLAGRRTRCCPTG
jgi:hypothetical protein